MGKWNPFLGVKTTLLVGLCYNYNLSHLQLECAGWIKIHCGPVESPFDGFSNLPKYLGRLHFHKSGHFFSSDSQFVLFF